jgi:uncharacterized membrane protein YphA (DoxX/SURF4 family)
MARRISIETISALFILLFVYASASKLIDYEKFTIQIGQSPLLTGFGSTIPWLVIVLELVMSLALAIPRLRLAALFGSFSLMVMFTAYIIAVLYYSPYVPCSCGGVLEKMGWKEHLIFNFAFMVLAVAGILLVGRKEISEEKI